MSVSIVAKRPDTAPAAVLVQGMQASGTSILSCVAALVTRPRAADTLGDDPFSHIEQSSAVAGLNRRILQDLGSAWSRPDVFFVQGKGVPDSAPLIRTLIRERYLDLAVGLLRSGFPAAKPIILEDPCLCLLHDLWDAALRQAGRELRTVHVFRNPLEVAAALKASQGFPYSRTLQLWVRYNIAALTAAQGPRTPLVVAFSDLLDPAHGLAGQLRAHLGLPGLATPDATMEARWRRLIDPAIQKDSVPEHVVARSPVVPSLVKRLHALLTGWNTQSSEQRDATLAELAAGLDDQSLFAGNMVQVKLAEPAKLAAPAISGGGVTRRLLLHYHLFKNAGTSVDAILRRNFGDRWINTEFPPRGQVNHQEAIRTLILDNPRLEAISSHTLMLPVPRIDKIEILPILFVRHPLDRMRSAHEFERRQDMTTVGSRMARELDFASYIRARLAMPGDRACRDFQVHRLAMAVPVTEGSELQRALAAVERLPFVGLVEAFKASAERLQRLVQPMFPAFQSFDVWENSTKARNHTLEERVDSIRKELGEESFALIMEANQNDMALYERMQDEYSKGLQRVSAHLPQLDG